MKLKKQIIIVMGIIIGVLILIYVMTRNPVLNEVKIEVGEKSISVDRFLKDSSDNARIKTNITEDMLSKIGEYEIVIVVDNKEFTSTMYVEDTIAPQAKTQNVTVYQDQEIKPDMFVQDIDDQTNVDISFGTEITTTTIGDYDVVIILEDEAHNQTKINEKLTVKKDDIAPTIKGLKNITVKKGGTVSYKKGITATDNLDKDIELKIDSSKVNLNKVGKYKVTYTATDKAKNVTSKDIYVNVISENKKIVSVDELYVKADSVLEKIINDSMTKRQKCKKIYDWVHANVSYVNSSDKSSWTRAAMYAFNNRKGDCFNYFAITKVLLTRAGIENIDLKATKHTHFWNFVKVEEGWYHLDTTPRVDHPNLFLRTDEWIDAYSKKHSHCFSYAEGSKPDSAKN